MYKHIRYLKSPGGGGINCLKNSSINSYDNIPSDKVHSPLTFDISVFLFFPYSLAHSLYISSITFTFSVGVLVLDLRNFSGRKV